MSKGLKNYLVKYKLDSKDNEVYRWSINEGLGQYKTYDRPAKLGELNQLLRLNEKKYPTNRYPDHQISRVFSISDNNKVLKVKGAKSLIDILSRIENEVKKVDIIEDWKNVNFEELDYELKENIMFDLTNINIGFKEPEKLFARESKGNNNKEIKKYKNAYQFFKTLFNTKSIVGLIDQDKFMKLIDKAMKEYIKEELDEDKQQYRFIKKRDKDNIYYLRDITSEKKYNNYDNNIAIYISLLALDSLNQEFYLERAEISDSELLLFFEQETSKEYKNFEVYSGIEVSNSELRGQGLNFKLKYRVKINNNNNKDKHFVYNQNSNSLFTINEDKVFSISNNDSISSIADSNSMDTVIREIDKLICGLKKYQEFINKIKSSIESFEDELKRESLVDIDECLRKEDMCMGYIFLSYLKREIIDKFGEKKFNQHAKPSFEIIRTNKFPNLLDVLNFCWKIKNSFDKNKLQKVYYDVFDYYYEEYNL